MLIKRILVLAPVLIVFLLLQSYFWVPTYEQQSKGNPERLTTFIQASIGDASILNPILSSDSASSEIENLVFEGLVDRDKDLSFRGRLARSWQEFEYVDFYIRQDISVPDRVPKNKKEWLHFFDHFQEKCQQMENQQKFEKCPQIKKVVWIPKKDFKVDKFQVKTDKVINLEVQAPPRIRLRLGSVDQFFFDRLEQVLDYDYFNYQAWSRFVHADQDLTSKELENVAKEILPPTSHNPVLIFYLRQGVKFHDGHKFDAGDVVFTYNSIMNPDNLSPRIADYKPIKEVKAVDKHTVKVVYTRLYSPALASWSIGILPEHLLNKEALKSEAKSKGQDPNDFTMRDSSFNRNPIGCGPFRFMEWESGEYISLTRFLNYWNGPANYKRCVIRIVPDLLTQEMEFYVGTLDSYSVQPHQVERLKKDERFQSFSGTSFGYTYIGYNMRRRPFKDKRVRQALSMALDIDQIIEYLLYGQGERITGPFVVQSDYYNQKIKPMPYDPDKSLELLRQSGWRKKDQGWLVKDGKRMQFTLITNTGNDIRKSVLAVVQDAWKRLGVDVRTDTLEWSVFIQERVNKLDFDAVVLGWVMGLEPDLYQIWHSSQTEPYGLNFVGFKNKEADRLICRIRREYDHEQQVEYCHRLHRIIAAEQPYTFLFVRRWTAVLDRKIVIKEVDEEGNVVYKKIRPTKTGDYRFYFNKWIKLPQSPEFALNG